MPKYHISPIKGDVMLCRAMTMCPLGDEANNPHFDNKDAAEAYLTRNLEENHGLFNPLSKTDNKDKTSVKRYESNNKKYLYGDPNDPNRKFIKEEIQKREKTNADRAIQEAQSKNHGIREYTDKEKYIFQLLESQSKALAVSRSPKFNKYYYNNTVSNLDEAYPIGSLVEIKNRRIPTIEREEGRKLFGRAKEELKASTNGEKVIRGRVVSANSFDITIVDSETGKKYEVGVDEGAQVNIYNVDFKTISKGNYSPLKGEKRASKARESFDENFKTGDTVKVISNFEYNGSENGVYKIFHKGPAGISLENSEGKVLTLSNDKLEENNYYNFLKNDGEIASNPNSGVDEYLNNQTPYPVNGWGNDYSYLNNLENA